MGVQKIPTQIWVLFIGLIVQWSAHAALPRQQILIPAETEKFGCISAEKADQYDRDFKIATNKFAGNQRPSSLCDRTSELKKLYNLITVLEQGRYEEAPEIPLDRGFVKGSYYDYVVERVSLLNRATVSGSRLIAAMSTRTRTMMLFDLMFGTEVPFPGIIDTLIHEARHAEGYPHNNCKAGKKEGMARACDETFEAGGSYAVGLEFNARVAVKGSNFHPLMKSLARLSAIRAARNDFNQPPTIRTEALLLVDDTPAGIPSVLRQGQLKTYAQVGTGVGLADSILLRHPEGSNIVVLPRRQSISPWAFDLGVDGDSREAMKGASVASLDWLVGEFTSELVLGKSSAKQSMPLEMMTIEYEGKDGLIRILADSVEVKLPVKRRVEDWDLRREPGMPDFQQILDTTPSGEEGLILADREGRVFRLEKSPVRQEQEKHVLVFKDTGERLPSGDHKMARFEGRTLFLSPQGIVQERGANNGLVDFDPLKGKRFRNLLKIWSYSGLE